jgi:tRNA A37 threonylcarbamoyladenosine dehydratase
MASERFEGIERLYSSDGLNRLARAHVCVVGIGGVGSWGVEALARTGIGRMTLVDLDEVCLSNINRQLPALENTIGRSKVEVMAERVLSINPSVAVHARQSFFTAATADELLSQPVSSAPAYDCVLDAIDNTANKCLLIARWRKQGIPVVTVGGAGGRKDPTAIRIADLARTTHDRLLDAVRSRLRKEHGFPRGDELFGVSCVYSTEPMVSPETNPHCPPVPAGARLNCEGGYGSACHVTGAFGFAAAGEVIRRLLQSNS